MGEEPTWRTVGRSKKRSLCGAWGLWAQLWLCCTMGVQPAGGSVRRKGPPLYPAAHQFGLLRIPTEFQETDISLKNFQNFPKGTTCKAYNVHNNVRKIVHSDVFLVIFHKETELKTYFYHIWKRSEFKVSLLFKVKH